MPLIIPKSERPKLSELAKANAGTLRGLSDALTQCPIDLDRSALARALTERVGDSLHVSPSFVEAFVTTLLSLYIYRASEETPAAKLASELVTAMRSDDQDPFETPTVGWQAFEEFITSLLSHDQTIGLAARAQAVAAEGQCHLRSVRILTDSRPVFSADASTGPQAMVIIHTLKLEYEDGRQEKELFLALDAADLLALRRALDRADRKDASLKLALAPTGLPLLSIQGDSDD